MGSNKDPGHIFISGNRFAVTRNLFEALAYLRYPGSDRTLWIDAICINQLDSDEKEIQIQRMYQVYGNARAVIPWIGIANAGTHEIFNSIGSFGDVVRSAFPGLNRGLGMGFTVALGDEQKNQRKATALKELAERSYWFRAWKFQEMKLATSLTIQCGVHKKPSGELHSLHINKQATATARAYNEKGKSVDRYINNLDSKFPDLTNGQDYPNHFLDCLLDRQCYDRRDNIFAFLNLFPRDLQQRIPINYKASTKEILLQSTRAIVESTGSLYILIIRGSQIPPESDEEQWQKSIPSWCPYLAAQYYDYGFKPHTMSNIFTEKA